MIKSIVTGGAGFIGSYIAEKLIELGHHVIIIDDLSTGKRENLPFDAEFHLMSLGSDHLNDSFLNELLTDTNYIFHLAANPRTSDGLKDPLSTQIQTVNGTIQLLTAVREMTVMPKIILASSCAIYGPGHDYQIIQETDSCNLGTPYAVQKYSQELYIKTFTSLWGLESVMLRFFNVYGTNRQSENGSYPNVIASFAKSKRETGRIWITGDGTQSRDFVHVYDVVDANIAAMNSNIKNAEIINVGTGVETSMNDIAKYFNCPIDYMSPRLGDMKTACANIEKAKKILNWSAKISFADGIKKYFND